MIPQLLLYFSCCLSEHDCIFHRRISLISCRPYDRGDERNARVRGVKIAGKEVGEL